MYKYLSNHTGTVYFRSWVGLIAEHQANKVGQSEGGNQTPAHPSHNPPEFFALWMEVDAPQSAKAGGVAVSGFRFLSGKDGKGWKDKLVDFSYPHI